MGAASPGVPGRGSLRADPGPLHRPLLPHQPTEPLDWRAALGATERSPAESLARAGLRGGAAGRDRLAGGRRAAAQGAGLANLRRRSPSYVYLGHLTPALPAGRGRPLARLPVGRWRPSGGARSVHASCGRRTGAAAGRKPRGPVRTGGVGGEGAVPSPLVTPARHSPRPRPGAPPPQPLRAGPRAPGGAGGGDEGNLKSLRSLPSAPPPQAPPPGPLGVLNHPPG